MADHWGNCVTHFNGEARSFIGEYFAQPDRVALIFAGAGFDPRARTFPVALSEAMGVRLYGVFVREDRGDTNPSLLAAADENEAALRAQVLRSEVWSIGIFDPVDKAAVGGNRIGEMLSSYAYPEGLTDIVLDMSALSNSISFPAGRIFVDLAKRMPGLNVHLMIASNPELDAQIVGEPTERAQAIRGFGQVTGDTDLLPATIWLPHLAPRRHSTLQKIRASLGDLHKVCPVLPFPASDPRRADELLAEYRELVTEDWEVDGRDLIYVSESNPLDSFRSIATLRERHFKSVQGYYEPELVLSPIGSKVMAAGAMMAAIRYKIAVQFVEAIRYDLGGESGAANPRPLDLVHVWLDGPIYAGYGST